MSVDSCPHLGLEGSPRLALLQGLQPEALWSCLTDKQKIAADEFFRTTLGLPEVANCEIMCLAFWEHALLIWVCLVYKKPISTPTTYFPPHPPHRGLGFVCLGHCTRGGNGWWPPISVTQGFGRELSQHRICESLSRLTDSLKFTFWNTHSCEQRWHLFRFCRRQYL